MKQKHWVITVNKDKYFAGVYSLRNDPKRGHVWGIKTLKNVDAPYVKKFNSLGLANSSAADLILKFGAQYHFEVIKNEN